MTLHLRDRPRGSIAAESRWLHARNFQAGNCGIVDLRLHLESEYAGPLHYLSFYLRRSALDAVTADTGSPRIGDLRHEPWTRTILIGFELTSAGMRCAPFEMRDGSRG